MKLRVVEPPRLFVIDLRTRMPFRYGIATVTALNHLIVELKLEVDGKVHRGLAAENLAPKWFTKNPNTTPQQDVDELLAVIRSACGFAASSGVAAYVYELWRRVYDEQERWGRDQKLPPLLVNFGTTLIERAMIDAFCRATGRPFAQVVADNALGMDLGYFHAEFDRDVPRSFLPRRPLRSIIVRHTVGLSDPLTDPEATLGDGLPESLESCVRAYDLTHFKIKIGGDAKADAARLRDIAAVLRERGGDGRDIAFTLDGNESYSHLDSFRVFWDAIRTDPFTKNLLFVEQPLHRDVALDVDLNRWPDRPPIIIDESDAELDSFPRALDRGYAGTSFKSCKGIFKGIANAALARQRGGATVLSAEDLTTVGPVSLLQDLAVVATLGISHVERNGHHYFRGLSMFPPEVQRDVLRHHGDLYRDIRGGGGADDEQGGATLAIRDGRIDVGSVLAAPFGYAGDIDPSSFARALDQ